MKPLKNNCKNCVYYEEWEHFISGYGTSIIHKCNRLTRNNLLDNTPKTINDIEILCSNFKLKIGGLNE